MHNLNKLYNQIRRYFIFHPQDKYGIIVLLIICCILVLVPEVYNFFKVEKDYTAIQEQKIAQFIAATEELDSVNTILAKNKNYQNNFTNNYNNYEATEKNAATASGSEYKKTAPTKPIDINTASISDFKLLKGIGKVFSERIVKYRDSKKGFNKMEELKDVYGISDSLFTALLPRLTISKKPETKLKNKTNYLSKSEKTKTEQEIPAKLNQPFVKVDINTATAEELKTLKGIGNVLSERIVKYRDSKGGFQNTEELNDVYGIEDSLYFALSSRIEMSKADKSVSANRFNSDKKQERNIETYASTDNSIITSEATTKKSESTKKVADYIPPVNININTADAKTLMQLQGIGEFRAMAIVEHRLKLGGFYQLKQVAEAYSIDDSVYQNILPSLTLGIPNIKKININEVEFKALLKHPYIDYKMTKHLINFRDQRKKGLKSIEELKESYLIDEELYQKLSVYLTVE